jgi:hypothetical protein
MRYLHQLIACISRSHWQIKEMANFLFSTTIQTLQSAILITLCTLIEVSLDAYGR